MNRITTTTMLFGLLVTAGLSGCAAFNKSSVQYTRTTTLGQELVDLQTARDQNAISEEEYNRARNALLDQAPNSVSMPGNIN